MLPMLMQRPLQSIIGFIPGIGDYIGFVLSLYAVLLSALFGLPLKVLGIMVSESER
jgi:UPF0716 family protein affecting phage T7 exclusion